MDAYEDIRSLGRGACAAVRLVRRRSDGMLLVVKRFHAPLLELPKRERQEAAQEVRLLAHLRHPNIIAFENSFIEDGVMHIIMEYAPGGTLHSLIERRQGELFHEDDIWEKFVQILQALRYVHSCNVLHRDIKCGNILLSGPENRVAKLSDFGISKILNEQERAATAVGTPSYMSPEVCKGKPYDTKSDVWALGCVLYEMCCLHRPFDGKYFTNRSQTLYKEHVLHSFPLVCLFPPHCIAHSRLHVLLPFFLQLPTFPPLFLRSCGTSHNRFRRNIPPNCELS